MNSMILDCPLCRGRFSYQTDGAFPERILCPECGKDSHCNDYSAMMFCPSCGRKLAIPLEMLNGNPINCPICESTFVPESNSLMADDGEPEAEEEYSEEKSRQLFREGELFDKYKIIRLLGRGGMAEVYLAEHLLLKQCCALKLMRPGLYDDNPRFIKRFVREAKLTYKIVHPNIVSVYDVGSDPKTGYLFIAMEYLDGESLSEYAENHPLDERELLEIARTMCMALSALEAEKVVHRDIKPSNIMRCKNGVLKLMDLGVAKAESKGGEDLTLTMEQASIGTPGYASPEQCECAHNVDIRSDIYCLGATLYHIAGGHIPFSGGTPLEIMLKVLRDEPVKLSNYRKDLSASFLQLIDDMMKKDPSKRPANPAALEKRIQKCIELLEHPEMSSQTPLVKEKSPAISADRFVLQESILPPPPSAEADFPVRSGFKGEGGSPEKGEELKELSNLFFEGEEQKKSADKKKPEAARDDKAENTSAGKNLEELYRIYDKKIQRIREFADSWLKKCVALYKKLEENVAYLRYILIGIGFLLLLLACISMFTGSGEKKKRSPGNVAPVNEEINFIIEESAGSGTRRRNGGK